MDKKKTGKLVFKDGTVFEGYLFGGTRPRVLEAVFTCAMTGYQEIVSDPAFMGKLAVFTYPLIGNCGVTDEDWESKAPCIGGIAVRDYNDRPSNFRYTKTLSEALEESDIPAISGIDTRALIKKLKKEGRQPVAIVPIEMTDDQVTELLKNPINISVEEAGCKKKMYSRTANAGYNVAILDCGTKASVIRMLNNRHCNVTMVPPNTDAETIRQIKPDGILIAGGPADPQTSENTISSIRELLGEFPLFSIGFGELITALAAGAELEKAEFSGCGLSGHPIKNLTTGKIITSEIGRAFCVSESSFEKTGFKTEYRDLVTGLPAGFTNKEKKVITASFHPEGGPGSEDGAFMFDLFIDMMKEEK